MTQDQHTALAGLGELLSVIGPTAGDAVDWTAAERIYGTAFPADYRAFTAAFGDGTIEEVISVHTPVTSPDAPPAFKVARLSEAAVAEQRPDQWPPEERGRHPLTDLLVWGGTAAADTLCWITTDPDPDRWPVAVYARGRGAWSVHPCGMAEFLAKLLRNEWPDWPISDDSLQDVEDPRFLHAADETAAHQDGLDPWE